MKALRFAVACLMLTLSGSAIAAPGSGTGTITMIWVDPTTGPDGALAFQVTAAAYVPGGGAGCAGAFRFVTTNKAAMSAILAAKLAGKTISIVGKGLCSVYPNAEDVHFFSFN